jgi:iron uptake system component EfeO
VLPRPARLGAITLLAASVVAAGAVSAGAAVPGAKSNTVKVTLTDDGCPAKLKTPAGATTFKVTNKGDGAVSEFEVLSFGRIVGEVENIAPGLSGEFSLTLKPGEYTTKCPGGDKHATGALTVTGTAATLLTPAQQASVDTYRSYLEAQTAELVTATDAFVAAVQSGNVELAKQLYGPARVPYERIEPVAETFGDLDPKIDARKGDVPDKDWEGFHKIEQALYVNHTTAGMSEVAADLQEDVGTLANLMASVELQPASIANGAVELLNEVSSSKITGEEERYSRLDLLDFAANVEGAKAAFDAVKPLLTGSNAALASQIDARFAAVDTALAGYKAGTGYVLYTALTSTDTKMLSQAIDALAEPLSKVAKQIVKQ